MATFRYSLIASCIAITLACATPAGQSAAATAPASMPAAQGRPGGIDPVFPERDSVGPAPTRFEWTTIEGAEHYEMELLTDIYAPVFSAGDIRGNRLPMPDGVVLIPGTYFWRVGAIRRGRLIADSGRSAFMVRESAWAPAP